MEEVATEYNVVINSPLDDVEIAYLSNYLTLYNFSRVDFRGLIINIISKDELRETVRMIASWLSRIGADGDVFCIQQVNNFYTGYVSEEVNELLRKMPNDQTKH